jgi:hypothetical protein
MSPEIGASPVILLAAFGAAAILAFTLLLVLRENLRDRRKRSFDVSASYHREPPPKLPERRSRGGPPQLPRGD